MFWVCEVVCSLFGKTAAAKSLSSFSSCFALMHLFSSPVFDDLSCFWAATRVSCRVEGERSETRAPPAAAGLTSQKNHITNGSSVRSHEQYDLLAGIQSNMVGTPNLNVRVKVYLMNVAFCRSNSTSSTQSHRNMSCSAYRGLFCLHGNTFTLTGRYGWLWQRLIVFRHLDPLKTQN